MKNNKNNKYYNHLGIRRSTISRMLFLCDILFSTLWVITNSLRYIASSRVTANVGIELLLTVIFFSPSQGMGLLFLILFIVKLPIFILGKDLADLYNFLGEFNKFFGNICKDTCFFMPIRLACFFSYEVFSK